MEFLEGAQITDKVIHVLTGKNAICAVAFWGIHAKAFLEAHCQVPSAISIVCDIHMGGTPAFALEELQMLGLTLHWRRGLHGKVFVSDVGAVVGSANASHNGLGLRGGPPFQPGYREAAVFLHPEVDEEAYQKASNWALAQFEIDDSGDVGVVDDAALAIARQRYRPMPPVRDFDESSLFDMVLAERKAFKNLAFVLTDSPINEALLEKITEVIDAGDTGEWAAGKHDATIDHNDLLLMRPEDSQVCPPRFIHIWAPEDGEAVIALHQRLWRENDQGWVYAPQMDGSQSGIFDLPLPRQKREIDKWFIRAAKADYKRARQMLAICEEQKEAVFFATAESFAEAIEALEIPQKVQAVPLEDIAPRAATEKGLRIVKEIYPILLERAPGGGTMSYGELTLELKARNPEDEVIANVIPRSLGKRLDLLRRFTNEQGYPDLSSLVVNNETGEVGESYALDPKEQRRLVGNFDWAKALPEFDQFIGARVNEIKMRNRPRRTRDEAKVVLWQYARANRGGPLPTNQQREAVLLLLMDGEEIEDVIAEMVGT